MVDAVNRNDLRDILYTLIAENAGEGPEAMRYVAETILNRADQRGLTPAEVVRQPHQYTGYSNPGPAAIRAQSDPAVLSAAEAAWALAQGSDDPTGGANHYYAPGTIAQPGWASGMTETANFGGHRYLTDRPVVPRGPVSPSPATASQSLNNRRTLNANAQSYAGQERGRANPVSQNLTRPGGIAAASNAAASTANPALQSALNRLAASKAPATPQSTQSAARRAALSIASNQSNAAQDGTGGRPLTRIAAAPVPASIEDRVTARNAAAVRELPASPSPAIPSAPMTSDLGAFPSSLGGFMPAPNLSNANPLVAAVGNVNGTNRLAANQLPPALYGAAEVPGLPRPRPSVASALSVSPQASIPLPRSRPSIAQALAAPQPRPTIGRTVASGPVVQAVVRGGSPSLPTLFRNPLTGALTNSSGAGFGSYQAPQQVGLFERLTGTGGGGSNADNVDRPWSTSQ